MTTAREAVERIAARVDESFSTVALTMEEYYQGQAISEVVEEVLSCKCGRPFYIGSRCKMCHDMDWYRKQSKNRKQTRKSTDRRS